MFAPARVFGRIRYLDLGPRLFVMFNKSMNFIRRLNRGNFYFSFVECEIVVSNLLVFITKIDRNNVSVGH